MMSGLMGALEDHGPEDSFFSVIYVYFSFFFHLKTLRVSDFKNGAMLEWHYSIQISGGHMRLVSFIDI